MNICAPFIKRPVMTTLVMFALLVFGIMSYNTLPISDMPSVDFPTISVSASLPGATPETMASSVATPLERQFSTIAGIDSMTSSSTQGSTSITLQFSLDRSIDSAAQDVQAAISATLKRLPSDMLTPPSYKKTNPAAAPILYLALTSDTQPMSLVDEYAETFLAQRISMVNGVAQVDVYGSQKYAVRINVDPDLIAARNITLDDVTQAVEKSNVNQPTGILQGSQQTFYIKADGQLTNADAYRKLVVAYRNGAPVRLGDLGQTLDSVENDKVASWFNNQRAIVLAVQRQPGTNTIEIVDAIRNLLPSFTAQLPSGINLKIIYDRSQSIRASVHDVQITLTLAAILVIAVIYLFLRNLSVIIIPSLALPMSLIGTFSVMYLLDFSLDNLSLLALTLSVGFVVDDAIVMLENITRHIEAGLKPFDAALKGSKEIGFTIVSMTVSLAIVFLPVLFMGGIVGRLLHEFAVSICAAIFCSGFISLTLTPMMAALFIKPQHTQHHEEYFLVKMRNLYEKTLQIALQHPRKILMSFFASILLTFIFLSLVPKGLLPNEDTGQLFANIEVDPSLSFQSTVALQQRVAEIFQKNPEVQSIMSSVGAGGSSNTANSGRIFITLKPFRSRKYSADEISQQLRSAVKDIPGIGVYVQNIPTIRIGGRLSKSMYQYTLQSTDNTELSNWATKFAREMSTLSALQDVTTDQQNTGPQVFVKILRDKAASLGVNAAQIEEALADAYGTQQISTIYTNIDSYEVIMQLAPHFQENPNFLSRIYLRGNNDQLVPLTAITQISFINGPLSINHQGQLPAVTVSFNLKPGYSLSQAITQIHTLQEQLNPPASLIADFSGAAQTFQSSQGNMALLILLAIVVIYIVLGILYESFIHPLTILSGLPSAAVGALITLLIFNQQLDLYGIIGIIMLIGIVKKNAIMMIDFALEAQRQQHLPPQQAIYQACLIRFRPIMMTTFAALLGTLPIALAFGEGAESRRPLGLVVVGGLLFSQLVTLYITPVIYVEFEKLKNYLMQLQLKPLLINKFDRIITSIKNYRIFFKKNIKN